MSPRKALEYAGRRLLITILGMMLRVRRRPISTLPKNPRIVVVRTDERIGNLLLLTPLLSSLRQRFPTAHIDLVANPHGAALLGNHPAISGYLPLTKRSFFTPEGIVRRTLSLRRAGYDLAIDATNPTAPSVTQAIIVRLSAAQHTVGFDHPGFGRMFSAPVPAKSDEGHEIDQRLRLLEALPGSGQHRQMSLGALIKLAPSSEVGRFLKAIAKPYAVLNLGARTAEKRLQITHYTDIANALHKVGLGVVLTYGPSELPLATRVAAAMPAANLAPRTELVQLAAVFSQALAVVSCDTGPMHLAVALQVPTCGLFVSTPMLRYGHVFGRHCAIDVQANSWPQVMQAVHAWAAAFAHLSMPTSTNTL